MHNPALSPQGAQGSPRGKRRWRRLLALPVAAIALSGCTIPRFGASPGDTTSSKSVFHLWQWFSIGAVVIGALVIALMLWSVVAHRRTSDEIPAQTQYHLPLEILYTVVPIVIVFVLFAATLVVENKETANPKTDVTINVNAFQWGWEFMYPGHNALVYGQTTQDPVMEMPVNENVHINLTSTDVIHGFYVHDFNFSRYALPGVVNQFTLRATNTGEFFGQCTQLCGLYHSLMWFRVKVVSDQEYTQWLASFNTPAGVTAAKAAASSLKQELATGTPSKTANTKFGR